LFVLSAAVLVFVCLSHGPTAVLKSGGISTLALMVVFTIVLKSPAQLLSFELVFWIPAVIAALVLRSTQQLSLAVLTTAAAGALAALALETVLTDLSALMLQQIADSFSVAAEAGQVEMLPAADLERLLASLETMLTPAFAVSVMAMATCALFVGRYWQAGLFRAGAFQEEFHRLQLGRSFMIASSLVVVGAVVIPAPLLTALASICLFALFLQGLSVVHSLVKQRGLSTGWLIGVYLMLILPHTVLLLAALGIADNLLRLRKL